MTVKTVLKSPVIKATDTSVKDDLQKLREHHGAVQAAGGPITVQDLINMGIIDSNGKKRITE